MITNQITNGRYHGSEGRNHQTVTGEASASTLRPKMKNVLSISGLMLQAQTCYKM